MFHPDLDWHNRDVKQETNMGERAGPIVESYCADHPGSCSEGKINMRYLYSSASGENKLVANLMSDAWGDFFNVDAVAKPQDAVIVGLALGDYCNLQGRVHLRQIRLSQ